MCINEILIFRTALTEASTKVRGKVKTVCTSERISAVAHYGRPLVRYQKKEEGSRSVNSTELKRFLDKIKFLKKIMRIRQNGPLNIFVRFLFMRSNISAVYNWWIGLVDWTSGLDYWTDLFSSETQI